MRKYVRVLLNALLVLVSSACAAAQNDCRSDATPIVSFEPFKSPHFQDPERPLPEYTVKGKLTLPVRADANQRCYTAQRDVPAVVILHGSSGIDSRGDFHAEALNAAGIATLEIDMWEARGVVGAINRPPLPVATYPDAFAALNWLQSHPNIAKDRIGVLGFSWGGIISVASAEKFYAVQFGRLLRFQAHVAHYPACYVFNNTSFPPSVVPSLELAGILFKDPTGAPMLIQIGTEDDYDNGAGPCRNLADSVSSGLVAVAVYEGAYHAWDRIMIPITVQDPFADLGSLFKTGKVPTVEIKADVDHAYAARKRVVSFFRQHL
jgi:dienelactone hydrolase